MMFFKKAEAATMPSRPDPANSSPWHSGAAQADAAISALRGRSIKVSQMMQMLVGPSASTEELARGLAGRIKQVAETMAMRSGYEAVVEDTDGVLLLEPTVGAARASLPALMSGVREALVAFISKQDKPEDAVAIIDWRALDLLVGLAEQTLHSTAKVGDFMPVRFTPEQAAQLGNRDFNRPLAIRQSAEDRERAIEELVGGSAERAAWPASS